MDAYIEHFEAQLDRLRQAIERGSHSVIDEILGEEKFKTTLKWRDSHSGENRAKLVNIAVRNDDAATVSLLLNHGVTINIDENRSKVIPPLLYAVLHRRDRIAEILMTRARGHVNQRAAFEHYYQLDHGDTALHAASRYGHDRLAVLLLNNGAAIDALNNKGETALHLTVKAKIGSEARRVIARCLLDYGARIDIGREPVLLFAMEQKNLDIARLIIDQRKDAIEKKDSLGRGTMHYVLMACSKSTDFVTMLIGKGMRVDEPNSHGERPLHHAVEAGDAVMMKFLLDHGADFDAKTESHKTPLYIAVLKENISIVNQLLGIGANVNVAADVQAQRDSFIYSDKETALHAACRIGNKEIVCALLKSGANPNEPTRSGRTPLGLACESGCEDNVWTLLKFGAVIQMSRWSYTRESYRLNIRRILIKHAVLAEDQIMCRWFYAAHKKDSYFVKCKKEIKKMKMTEFYDDLTFFKILMARESQLMAMMKNEKLREAFEAGYTEVLFPYYARHINERFGKVKLMLEVRNSVEEILNSIFLTVLPCDVTNKILDYVGYEDMQFLLDSYEEPVVKLKNIF